MILGWPPDHKMDNNVEDDTDDEIEDMVDDDVDVDQVFTKAQLSTMCALEKLRYKNMRQNYEALLSFGKPGYHGLQDPPLF
jgi:hypothetical protein